MNRTTWKKLLAAILVAVFMTSFAVPALAAQNSSGLAGLLNRGNRNASSSNAAPASGARKTSFDGRDTAPINAKVKLSVKHAEFKGNTLVVTVYVINGMDRPVWITGDQIIRIYSNGKLIAKGEAKIPESEEYDIPSGKYDEEKITFAEHEFDPNASLENLTADNYTVTYQWADE